MSDAVAVAPQIVVAHAKTRQRVDTHTMRELSHMPTTWAHIRFDSSAMFDMDSPINPERLFSAVEFTANSMIAVTEQVENRMSPILNTRRKMVASHPTFSMTSRSGTWYIVRKNRIVWVRPSGSLMWPHALFSQLARGA